MGQRGSSHSFGTARQTNSHNVAEKTWGEMKKLLTGETGLQPTEQRLLFRGKERENGDYLDMCE
ncbi:hypothetical protein Syun_028222 [Stephania yunnanensis]|uniref:Ubiquitin-like domain-containing protein n=1 Tax=Stephania yunnanensis TaxID=152371 RepID=A0AAP0EGZ4_9MAGN